MKNLQCFECGTLHPSDEDCDTREGIDLTYLEKEETEINTRDDGLLIGGMFKTRDMFYLPHVQKALARQKS